MKKKFLVLALILCLSLCTLGLVACGDGDDGIFKFTLNDDGATYTVTVKEDATVPSEVTIPTEHDGKPVTVIGKFAFQGKTTLNFVTIPEGIVTIDVQAFNGCSGLNSIYSTADNSTAGQMAFPASLKTIGQMSFASCTMLGKIEIPDTVEEVGIAAFMNCRQAGTLTIGSGISEIKNGTFEECKYLATVEIPGNVKTIGGSAFSGCQNLSSVYIKDGVQTIEPNAFSHCENLAIVKIPATVTSAGDLHEGPFFGCPISVLETPASICRDLRQNGNDELISLKIIGSGAIEETSFMDCEGLLSVEICEGVTAIGYNAFSGCTSLSDVSLPDGLLTIEKYAFASCNATSFVVPASVTTIEEGALWGTGVDLSNQIIYFKGTEAQWTSIDFNHRDPFEMTVYFYSATATMPTGEPHYWHYDPNSKQPVLWA